jgi:hypothetical protein
MDVNVERAEDVLTHKWLLEQARDPVHRPAFAVRAVQVTIFQISPELLYDFAVCWSERVDSDRFLEWIIPLLGFSIFSYLCGQYEGDTAWVS